MLSLGGFARGSVIIHDFHSRSVMLPGTVMTSRSVALCLSLPWQLPRFILSLHAYLKRLEKAVHHGEISAQSLSVTRSRASLFQSPAPRCVQIRCYWIDVRIFVSSHPVQSHLQFFLTFFFFFFKCSRLSSSPVEINRAALSPAGPFVSVFTMMSRRL